MTDDVAPTALSRGGLPGSESSAAQGLAPGLRADDLPAPTVQCHAANLVEWRGEDHRGGALSCVWFGGTQEGVGDICVWQSTLGADGRWSAPVKLSSDDSRSEQNPILFQAPNGDRWLLHTAQRAGDQDTAMVRVRKWLDNAAPSSAPAWSPTTSLIPDAGVFVRQPIVVVEGGERRGDWLLPIFHCRTRDGARWSGEHDDSAVLISSDQGESWVEHAVPQSTGLVHMCIVPMQRRNDHDGGGDGSSFVAFFRSRFADRVHRSVSHDAGRTWSVPEPTPLKNNNSSIQAVRLQSGRLAMVFNDACAADATERRVSLYDEIDSPTGATYQAPNVPPNSSPNTPPNAPTNATVRTAFWGAPRAPMTVALSDDDGLTWPMRRDLETGDGYCMTNNSAERRNRELSYPSVVQTRDGLIHVAYTHHRQRIRHVCMSEAWVMGEDR